MTWFLGDRSGSNNGNMMLSCPDSRRNRHRSRRITVSGKILFLIFVMYLEDVVTYL